METTIAIFGWNFFAIVVMMLCGWFISLVYRNVTIVDSLWGLGFIIITWLTFLLSEGYPGRKWLISLMVTFWGIRLVVYLSWRNWGAGEDPRYTTMRNKSGDRFWIISLFKVFLLQAIFMFVISMVIQMGQIPSIPNRFTWLDGIGLTVWCIGFFFESVGDYQLARFKGDPVNKGKVMNRGLWAYTRHPNYFGECLVWWGIFFVTLATPSGGWWVISPIIITTVLVKMTGIPLTEKSILDRRPAYKTYIQNTSAFFPWFPKENIK
jgi:steroid 5-alpha reductase family enzyme